MKYYISNRGNLKGCNKFKENTPEYIQNAINLGYDCVVDVSVLEGILYFNQTNNHLYIIDWQFIINNRKYLWLRCKNRETLNYLVGFSYLRLILNNIVFTYNKEKLKICEYIWSPKYEINEYLIDTIIVMPEMNKWKTHSEALGVCSDYIEYIRDYYLL